MIIASEISSQKSQLENFSGEGRDVGKALKEWIERMDDYFDLASSTNEGKATMARFKLEKTAKLWWKDHCQTQGIDPITTTWPYIRALILQLPLGLTLGLL